MTIKFKLSYLTIILFAAYNMVYAFYMAGLVKQRVYFGAMLLYIFATFLYIAVANGGRIRVKELKFLRESGAIVLTALVFLAITLIEQMIHLHFQGFFLMRLLYLILPALLVFCMTNSSEDASIFAYILLARMVLQFFLINRGHLSLGNIFHITLHDTNSSLFESSQAHEFFIITVLLLYMDKKLLALISTLGCIMCFKRVSFLLCVATWFIFPLLKGKDVPRWAVRTCEIIMLVMPFIALWMYDGNGAQQFQRFTGFNLDSFATSRMTLVRNTIKHFAGNYNGYGTIRNYFENRSAWYRHLVTMHCDILVLYLECTIIGVFAYIHNLLKIGRKNALTFYVLVYSFIEIIVSHYIEMVPAWTVFFLLAYMTENEKAGAFNGLLKLKRKGSAETNGWNHHSGLQRKLRIHSSGICSQRGD